MALLTSGKIPQDGILDQFQVMLDEHWSYGTDTRKGNVDCSGAFVYVYGLYGLYLYHGSNRMARVDVQQLIPIGQAKIVPCMAAFKIRKPTDEYYALPSEYREGGSRYNGDLNDYYHVGLTSRDCKHVLNAQSTNTGFVSSDISKGWTHVAYLKKVDYEREVVIVSVSTATVSTSNGKSLNIRASASTSAAVLGSIPNGTTVTVVAKPSSEWWQISYNGISGYVATSFLKENGTETITLPRSVAETMYSALGSALGV